MKNKEEKILETLQECIYAVEMDSMPEVALSKLEDGDTRFTEDGFFVIYDIKTNLRAEDFVAIKYKDNDDRTRDPYIVFYLTGNRHIYLSCVAGNFDEPNIEAFKDSLVDDFGGEAYVEDMWR